MMGKTAPFDCRPQLSLVLVAFNQEQYIQEAVEGAFSQTYSPLEIILSDDCSDDRTFEIMREMAAGYTGPHTVRLNRNDQNLGLIGHVNKAFSMAVGELIVAAAGDDVSLPERCDRLHSLWKGTAYQADGLCSAYFAVESDGEQVKQVPQGLTIDAICRRGAVGLLGATAAWSRRLIQRWGPLPAESLAEDRVLSFRALLGGGLVVESRPLVRYRVASRTDLSGQTAWSARRVWELQRDNWSFRTYLNDLDRWVQLEAPSIKEAKYLRRLLERSSNKTHTDACTLGGGRPQVFLFCLRLLAGLTHHQFSPLGRIRLVLLLFRGRIFGRSLVPFMDVSNHRAFKEKSRADNPW